MPDFTNPGRNWHMRGLKNIPMSITVSLQLFSRYTGHGKHQCITAYIVVVSSNLVQIAELKITFSTRLFSRHGIGRNLFLKVLAKCYIRLGLPTDTRERWQLRTICTRRVLPAKSQDTAHGGIRQRKTSNPHNPRSFDFRRTAVRGWKAQRRVGLHRNGTFTNPSTCFPNT